MKKHTFSGDMDKVGVVTIMAEPSRALDQPEVERPWRNGDPTALSHIKEFTVRAR
jgi:hypothetical protein